MVTADQLLCHVVGDFVLQSTWMAAHKTERTAVALVHALAYALPFLLLRPSVAALAVLVGSHVLIDRFRLARYVCWIRNGPWKPLTATGHPESAPPWLAAWLVTIVDGAIHVAINGAALRWL